MASVEDFSWRFKYSLRGDEIFIEDIVDGAVQGYAIGRLVKKAALCLHYTANGADASFQIQKIMGAVEFVEGLA